MKLALGKILSDMNIRQARLAEMADLTPGYVSLLVSGKKTPSAATLEKIASAIGVHVPDLYRGRSTTKIESHTGFSEDTVEFVTKPAQQPSHKADDYQYLKAKRSDLSLGIVNGDILHLDMSGNRRRGIAAVTRADHNTGNAATTLRQVEDNKLLPLDPGAAPEALIGAGYEYAILGWIVGLERQL